MAQLASRVASVAKVRTVGSTYGAESRGAGRRDGQSNGGVVAAGRGAAVRALTAARLRTSARPLPSEARQGCRAVAEAGKVNGSISIRQTDYLRRKARQTPESQRKFRATPVDLLQVSAISDKIHP